MKTILLRTIFDTVLSSHAGLFYYWNLQSWNLFEESSISLRNIREHCPVLAELLLSCGSGSSAICLNMMLIAWKTSKHRCHFTTGLLRCEAMTLRTVLVCTLANWKTFNFLIHIQDCFIKSSCQYLTFLVYNYDLLRCKLWKIVISQKFITHVVSFQLKCCVNISESNCS